MAETQVSISTNFSDPSAYPDCPTVGTVHEVGINGEGFMLADMREIDPELRHRRKMSALDPPRLATTDAPFTEAVERYSFTAFSDFAGGAGQVMLDREGSQPNRFFDSDGVNPFDKHRLTLLKSTAVELSSAYASIRTAVVGTELFTLTGDTELSRKTAPGAAATTITLGATTTDLASDGQYWYAAQGTAMQRGTTAAATWGTAKGDVVWFAGGRICTAYKGAGSTTPNVFSTWTDAGAEEVGGGRLILPPGWTIVEGSAGGGNVYFAANVGDTGVIYRWKIGTTDAPAVAMDPIAGLSITDVYWYQGALAVRARRALATGAQAVILRCPADNNGNLTPFFVTELGTSTTTDDYGPGSFAANERTLVFSWPKMDGTLSGIGAVDLASGGYTKWLKSTAGSGAVRSIAVWQGRLCFTVAGTGVVLEQTSYLATGTLTTSVSDKASTLEKVFDQITLHTLALATGQSVSVAYSLDGGSSFASLFSIDAAGQQTRTVDLAKKAGSIALRLTLAGPGTTTPTVSLAQVRLHPHSLADQIIQVPINCADRITGLNGRELPESKRGAGAARVRKLEGLIQSRVKYQDLDWPITAQDEIFEVVDVDVRTTAVYDRAVARNQLLQVAVLTMRKVAK